MMIKTYLGIILLIAFSFICIGQQQEKIRESVSVINVEIPVRVLLKGQPVGGLNKSDFELFIGKQSVPIHGFTEVRRKIISDTSVDQSEVKMKPRLFLLIFNVADYNFELQEGLDHLFSKVIQKGDRLIVFSNNYYLRDHTITDLETEKKRIEQAIKLESKKILREIISLEQRLNLLLAKTKARMHRMCTGKTVFDFPMFNGNPEFLVSFIREFFDSIVRYFEEYKEIFFSINSDELVNLSRYLKGLEIEKWGFNFYQIGGYPRLKPNAWLDAVIRLNYDQFEGGNADGASQHWAQLLNDTIVDARHRLEEYSSPELVDQSKLFINTKITFNTLLMRYNFKRGILPDDFEYKTINNPTESLIRNLTNMTGGITVHSNDYNVFVNKIIQKEDIVYVLTYDKALVKGSADARIRVKLSAGNRRYNVLFDDHQQPEYLKEKAKALELKLPDIRIKNPRIEDKELCLTLANIMIPPVEKFANGKVELLIKILDSSLNEIINRKTNIEAFQSTEELRINLGKIINGNYDVIIEANDLTSKSNDFIMMGVKVLSENIILGQKVEYDSTEFEKKLSEQKKRMEVSQDISIKSKPGKPQSAIVKSSKILKALPISSYPEPLKAALVKTTDYCNRLQDMSLYFFCREKVVESVNLGYLQELKPVNEIKLPEENIRVSQSGQISSSTRVSTKWGDHPRRKSFANRNIANLNYIYDYQLTQKEGKIEEKRVLLRDNGKRVNVELAPLKTRFKYHNIIFGPMVFSESQHPNYKYEIIKKTRKKRRNILIVEATPVGPEAVHMLTGRLWIDEKDHSIIRVEATHRSIENYEYIELYARKNMLIPEIKIVQEYNVEKNGVRFPSSATIEEAYITPQKKKIVLSSIKVKYSDYKFFTVGTKVTEEKIKK